MHRKPTSCDTFAVLPPGADGCVIFGKNSDRPAAEVQEVVYVPAADHPPSSKLRCTYIEVDQVEHTYATVLSKPSWMWGAEMGANEHDVCIGNEAVWTRLHGSDDLRERLLGMDLLRLGLERADTARKAVAVIAELLEAHGQGGNCSDIMKDFSYHNSFLIADPTEVWILETAQRCWAAEQVTSGVRNISNDLSIGTKIDLKCHNLEEFAEHHHLWVPKTGPINFKIAYGFINDDDDEEDSYRYFKGKQLLLNLSKSGNFKEADMFRVLRDEASGICMVSGTFITTASQVSVLRPKSSGKPSVHWFTGTPVPTKSVFKPFVFSPNVDFPADLVSPKLAGKSSSRAHALYKLHQDFVNPTLDSGCRRKMEELESLLVEKVSKLDLLDADTLLRDAVEEEKKLYSKD